MKMDNRFSVPNFVSLFISGVGFVTVVIVFAFMNFETKSSAEEKTQNIRSRQEDLDQSLRELRSEMKSSQSEMNAKLDRLLYFVKSR